MTASFPQFTPSGPSARGLPFQLPEKGTWDQFPLYGGFSVDKIDVPEISASLGFPGIPAALGTLSSNFGLVCEGTLHIRVAGNYMLGLISSEGAILTITDRNPETGLLEEIEILDTDNWTGTRTYPDFSLAGNYLAVGAYPFRLEYQHINAPQIQLQLGWGRFITVDEVLVPDPDFESGVIPASAFIE
jgi:hypothetical protein